MFAQAQMTGTRLEYVVVPIADKVKRVVCLMAPKVVGKDKKGNDVVRHELTKVVKEQPGGFMVYFPRGHCLRFRDQAHLRQYRLDRQPKIINLEGLNDPNSPLGQMMLAQDEKARRGAFESLEKQVIALVNANVRGEHLTRVEQLPEVA